MRMTLTMPILTGSLEDAPSRKVNSECRSLKGAPMDDHTPKSSFAQLHDAVLERLELTWHLGVIVVDVIAVGEPPRKRRIVHEGVEALTCTRRMEWVLASR